MVHVSISHSGFITEYLHIYFVSFFEVSQTSLFKLYLFTLVGIILGENEIFIVLKPDVAISEFWY